MLNSFLGLLACNCCQNTIDFCRWLRRVVDGRQCDVGWLSTSRLLFSFDAFRVTFQGDGRRVPHALEGPFPRHLKIPPSHSFGPQSCAQAFHVHLHSVVSHLRVSWYYLRRRMLWVTQEDIYRGAHHNYSCCYPPFMLQFESQPAITVMTREIEPINRQHNVNWGSRYSEFVDS